MTCAINCPCLCHDTQGGAHCHFGRKCVEGRCLCDKNNFIKKRSTIHKFKQEPKYPHNRSEGMTRRKNSGSYLQEINNA